MIPLKTIKLDIWSRDARTVNLKQGEADGRQLRFEIYDGAGLVDLTGATAMFAVKKPDGSLSVSTGTTTDGGIDVTIPSQAVTTSGYGTAELQIDQTGAAFKTFAFRVMIEPSIDIDGAAESVTEFSALHDMIEDVQGIFGVVDDLAGTGRTTETVKGNADAVSAHTADTANPHEVTKAQVGLGNVLNVAQIPETDRSTLATAANLTASMLLKVDKTSISPLRPITDTIGGAGARSLARGDTTNGYYGLVYPSEFGEIAGNPAGQTAFNGSNLAIAIGLTAGTAVNSTTPWMKFSSGGEVLFVPLKPLRHSVSWNNIYARGAVYGDGTIGVNPPGGRAGNKLAVVGTDTITISGQPANDGFLKSGAVIAAVGDTIVTRNFANAANNGSFKVYQITDTVITVTTLAGGAPNLVAESGAVKASIYKFGTEVLQNRDVVIGGRTFRVQLLRGASQDPLNSYNDTDRDMVGAANQWNNLILPLHEKAKLKNWAYPNYTGTTEDWGIWLTDNDLVTHNTFGDGSYTWCQETSDTLAFARVLRGYYGASYGTLNNSWPAPSPYGWRPALRLLS